MRSEFSASTKEDIPLAFFGVPIPFKKLLSSTPCILLISGIMFKKSSSAPTVVSRRIWSTTERLLVSGELPALLLFVCRCFCLFSIVIYSQARLASILMIRAIDDSIEFLTIKSPSILRPESFPDFGCSASSSSYSYLVFSFFYNYLLFQNRFKSFLRLTRLVFSFQQSLNLLTLLSRH